MPGTQKINNAVIFRTDRIGEVLLSTVAIDALRRRYPECLVTFVTSVYSAPLLERRDDVKEVITYETMGGKGNIASAVGLALKLRARKFDAAIVLNPHRSLHLACFLAGIPVRAGYGRKWGSLLNRRIKDKRDSGGKHEIEYTMDVMDLVGAGDGTVKGPLLSCDSREREAMSRKLRAAGAGAGGKLVAVHPGSSNPAKAWPREMYAQTIKSLKDEFGGSIDIFIIGTANETPLAAEIIGLSGGRAVDLTGRFALEELIAFLSLCSVFIGNDTGPMHIAAALGIPVVAIFGRNIPGVSPKRWGPVGERNIVLHENPGCEPCYDTTCPYGYKCLRRITPESVVKAAEKILGED